MKTCNKCGCENNDEQAFCGQCGNKLDQPIPQQNVVPPQQPQYNQLVENQYQNPNNNQQAYVPPQPPKKKKKKLGCLIPVIIIALFIIGGYYWNWKHDTKRNTLCRPY